MPVIASKPNALTARRVTARGVHSDQEAVRAGVGAVVGARRIAGDERRRHDQDGRDDPDGADGPEKSERATPELQARNDDEWPREIELLLDRE
jgi:hypothetical protein